MHAPARPRHGAALLVPLLLLALVAGGCQLDAPETNRAEAQTRKVLTEAGVPVELVFLFLDRDPESSEDVVTINVTYESAASSDDERLAGTVARTIWFQSIAEVDRVVVGSGGPSTELSGHDLEQRFGARPPGLVQVDARTMRKEQDEQIGGLIALAFASMVPLLVGLVMTVVGGRRRGRARHRAGQAPEPAAAWPAGLRPRAWPRLPGLRGRLGDDPGLQLLDARHGDAVLGGGQDGVADAPGLATLGDQGEGASRPGPVGYQGRVEQGVHHDLGGRGQLADAAGGADPVQDGHAHVGHHHVGAQPGDQLEPARAVVGLADHVDALVLEQPGQRQAHVAVVVDQQHAQRPDGRVGSVRHVRRS
jgi:hypothetical protein